MTGCKFLFDAQPASNRTDKANSPKWNSARFFRERKVIFVVINLYSRRAAAIGVR